LWYKDCHKAQIDLKFSFPDAIVFQKLFDKVIEIYHVVER
jgi:hypothetical protein